MKAVLILNAGSSSLKFALYPLNGALASAPAISGQVEGIGATPELTTKTANGSRNTVAVDTSSTQLEQQHRDSLTHLFRWLTANNPALDIVAAGHRVVHGGERYSAPVELTPDVLAELDHFVPLAPLHQPQTCARCAVADLMPASGRWLLRHRLPAPSRCCRSMRCRARSPRKASALRLPRPVLRYVAPLPMLSASAPMARW